MKYLIRLFWLTWLLFAVTNCSKDENVPVEPATYTKVTLPYKVLNGVYPNLLSLDIYHFNQPNQPKPVVVYVHGGAWSIGDKANSMTNKTNLFSSLNYLFISVNYRLSPSVATTDPNRVMFPVHNDDVADAMKWIFQNITSYGGNPKKMALMGHSAGAHLVSLTGTSSEFLPSRGIALNALKGIVSIDTEGYNVIAQVQSGNDTYINAFGTVPAALASASPIEQVVSGVEYPNFFVAKRGTAARIALANDFIAKLRTVGVSVTEVTGNQYDHEGINDAIGAPGETAITEPLKLFLSQCFQ